MLDASAEKSVGCVSVSRLVFGKETAARHNQLIRLPTTPFLDNFLFGDNPATAGNTSNNGQSVVAVAETDRKRKIAQYSFAHFAH